ncbi:MAG: hypothetical protein OJF50_003795 [Nitrospira sp.]|jgi:hypothetical protein|nr:hypothetical protein [Nitrospira sp.]
MGAYLPLFTFDVEHAFFSNGTGTDLDMFPSRKTSIILNNAGLLNRMTATGVSMFYDQSRIEALQLCVTDPDDPLQFEFAVFSRNKTFDLSTEPSPTRLDSILHFDSKLGKTDANGRLRLHEPDYVSQKDFVPLTSPFLNDLLSSKDRLAKPTLTVTIHGEDVGIHPSAGFPEGASKRYYVRFKAREVVWKYYLLGDIRKTHAHIADLDNETEFESAGDAVLPDRRTAVSFRSKVSLPLKERSRYRFQLKDPGSEGGKVLIQRLPVASPDRLYVDMIDGKEVMVSEIYINY